MSANTLQKTLGGLNLNTREALKDAGVKQIPVSVIHDIVDSFFKNYKNQELLNFKIHNIKRDEYEAGKTFILFCSDVKRNPFLRTILYPADGQLSEELAGM